MTAGLKNRHLFCVGLGYSALALADLAIAAGMKVSGTVRDGRRVSPMRTIGIRAIDVSEDHLTPDALEGVTDLLISAPPHSGGCPAFSLLQPTLQRQNGLHWIGYLSSTAVYGDCGGVWIDETRAPAPRSEDAKARLVAEGQWTATARMLNTPLDILRIAGIYGPERNSLARLRSGAKAILKPGQVFNRIHRDDIAGAAFAALQHPESQRLTNLSDGAPCAASDILLGLAEMLDLPKPQEVSFEDAGLPPGAAGFYAENRRLRNDRLLALPGFRMSYPDWRAGYAAILQEEAGE